MTSRNVKPFAVHGLGRSRRSADMKTICCTTHTNFKSFEADGNYTRVAGERELRGNSGTWRFELNLLESKSEWRS